MEIIKRISSRKAGIVWDRHPLPVLFIMDEANDEIIAFDQLKSIGTKVQSRMLCIKMRALISYLKYHPESWTKEKKDNYQDLLHTFLHHCQKLAAERDMETFKLSLTVEEFTFFNEHAKDF